MTRSEQALLERVQSLEDRLALQDLVSAYAFAIDHRQWWLYAELFTESGEFITPYFRVARDDLQEWIEANVSHYPATQHIMANHSFAIDGDSARGTYDLLAVHLPDADRLMSHSDVGGRYEAEFWRVDGSWRFELLSISFVWEAGEKFEPASDSPGVRSQGEN